MLLANKVVAEHLFSSSLSEVAVLRNHSAPDTEKANKLTKLIHALGIDFWESHNAGALHKSLQRVHAEFGETVALCIETMAMVHGMKQATYFPVGSEEDPHHYALNFDFYTHFTSPIRRYPDVMVHRVLASLLGLEDEYQEGDQALEQCSICNG